MSTKIELTSKQSTEIKKAIATLNRVRKEVQTHSGNDINWYLEDTANFHLMDGHSHDAHGNANRDMVIDSFNLSNASGGGW